MSRRSCLGLALLWCNVASAEPLVAHDAHEVRLMVAGKARRAVQLRPSTTGWRLELGTSRARVAEVFDVTPNTPARTFTLAVTAGEVVFDRTRFAGGHAYRLQLFTGDAPLATGFVYLVAEAPAKEAPRRRAQELRFEPAEDAPAADDRIQPVPKAPL